jgi:hypothetical protein
MRQKEEKMNRLLSYTTVARLIGFKKMNKKNGKKFDINLVF